MILAFPITSYACSFVPGYEEFLVMPVYGDSGKSPNKPIAEVVSIKRGYNDGNGASCSDAGIIKIGFKDSNPYHKTGYSFTIIEGSLEDKVFPDGYVRPPNSLDSKNEVMFVWFDGSNNYQEAIDIKVEIRALS